MTGEAGRTGEASRVVDGGQRASVQATDVSGQRSEDAESSKNGRCGKCAFFFKKKKKKKRLIRQLERADYAELKTRPFQ